MSIDFGHISNQNMRSYEVRSVVSADDLKRLNEVHAEIATLDEESISICDLRVKLQLRFARIERKLDHLRHEIHCLAYGSPVTKP